MSAAPGHPSLRARIAEVTGQVLGNNTHSDIGRALGISQTTVSRRGDDFHAWFGDGLDLAAAHPTLAESVVAFVTGEFTVRGGEAVKAVGALVREIREDGEMVAAIARTLEDGRVSRDEARWILDLIQARRKEEDADLIPSLRAIMDPK